MLIGIKFALIRCGASEEQAFFGAEVCLVLCSGRKHPRVEWKSHWHSRIQTLSVLKRWGLRRQARSGFTFPLCGASRNGAKDSAEDADFPVEAQVHKICKTQERRG